MSSADAVTLIKKAAEIIENDPEAAPLAPMLRYVADNIAGRRHIMVDLDRNCVVIDVNVMHLRRKLADAGFTIKTHWGKGLELLHNGRTTAPSTSKRK